MEPSLIRSNLTNLECLLLLYSKHKQRMYLNYFREFKQIVAWLELPIPERELPARYVPWYYGSYETQELSKYLGVHSYYILKAYEHLTELGKIND